MNEHNARKIEFAPRTSPPEKSKKKSNLFWCVKCGKEFPKKPPGYHRNCSVICKGFVIEIKPYDFP